MEAETRYVRFNQNIGVFVVRFSKSIRGNLCAACASRHFFEYTFTTLLLGWWGVISFIMTPFILIGNIYYYCSRKNVIAADSNFMSPSRAAFPDGHRMQHQYGQADSSLPASSASTPHNYDLRNHTAEPSSSEDMPQDDEKQRRSRSDSSLHKWDI